MFGSIEKYDALRQSRGLRLLEELRDNLHYAARQLRKSPLATLTALFTIALGISTNVTMFTAVDAFILRPLPYRDPGLSFQQTRSLSSAFNPR